MDVICFDFFTLWRQGHLCVILKSSGLVIITFLSLLLPPLPHIHLTTHSDTRANTHTHAINCGSETFFLLLHEMNEIFSEAVCSEVQVHRFIIYSFILSPHERNCMNVSANCQEACTPPARQGWIINWATVQRPLYLRYC